MYRFKRYQGGLILMCDGSFDHGKTVRCLVKPKDNGGDNDEPFWVGVPLAVYKELPEIPYTEASLNDRQD